MSQISYRLSYSYHIYNVVTRNKQKIFWISPTKNELSGKYQWNSVSQDWRVNEVEEDKINWRSEIPVKVEVWGLRCETGRADITYYSKINSLSWLLLTSFPETKQNTLTSTILIYNFSLYFVLKKYFPFSAVQLFLPFHWMFVCLSIAEQVNY